MGSGLCGSPCKAVRKDLAGLLAGFGMLGQLHQENTFQPGASNSGHLGPFLPPGTNLWATYSNPGSSEEVSPPLQPELTCVYQRGEPHIQT